MVIILTDNEQSKGISINTILDSFVINRVRNLGCDFCLIVYEHVTMFKTITATVDTYDVNFHERKGFILQEIATPVCKVGVLHSDSWTCLGN